MNSPTTARTLQRPSRRVQLAVWALLAVLVGVGFALTATSSGAGAGVDPGASLATASQPLAADESIVLSAGDSRVTDLGTYYGESGSRETVELLPAWRWQNPSLYSNLNATNIPGHFFNGIAGLFFFISAWIWAILLAIVKFTVGLDLVHSAARIIDAGFLGLTSSIWSSGVVWILLVIGLIMAAKMMMQGQSTKVLPLMIAVIIPISFMQALSMQVNANDTQNDNGTYVPPSGSPAWVASQGVWLIDSTAQGLGGGFGVISGVSGLGSVNAATEEKPNCFMYNQTLYSQYNAWTNPTLGRTKDQANAEGAEGETAGKVRDDEISRQAEESYKQRLGGNVPVVSYLWERAYLRYWTGAQLGYSPQADRVACHILEDRNGTSAKEQSIIGIAAGYPNPTDNNRSPYLSPGSKKQWEAEVLAWAACEWDEGYADNQGWKASNKAWGNKDNGDANQTDGADCSGWYNGTKGGGDYEGGDDNLEYDDTGDINSRFNESHAEGDTEAEIAAKIQELQDAKEMVKALRGDNGGTRMLNGLMALVTALFYLYALGPLAVGTVIAQFGVVLLLIMLPATLMLLAIPTKTKERHPAGKRLMRLTLAFMAAKLVLTVVMTLLINVIGIFEALMGALGNGLNGISHALIPLAALFLVRYLLKQAGLGDLTSLSGSMGMATAGAMGAAGDANGRGGWSKEGAAKTAIKANKLGDRLGVNRADAFAKRNAKRATLAPGRAIGGALALGDEKRALVGAKNEEGQRTQLGLAQRMASKAAQLGYGSAAALAGANRQGVDKNGKPLGPGRRFVPGSRTAAQHMQRLGRKHASRAALAKQQRADLREHIRATRFKGASDRRLAASNRFGRTEALIAAHQAMGKLGMTDDQIKNAQLGYDPKTGSARFTLNGRDHWVKPAPLEQGEARADFLGYADVMKLKEEQVVGNQRGLGATYVPVPRQGKATAQLVQAKTREATLELATDVLQYVPDHAKKKLPGWGDDQMSTYLHGLRVMAGGLDPVTGGRVDFLKENGIDISTEAGRAEVDKALAGQPSKLDVLQGSVEPNAAQLAALVARVNRMGRGSEEAVASIMKAGGDSSLHAIENRRKVEETTTTRDTAKAATNDVQADKQVLVRATDSYETLVSQAKEKSDAFGKLEQELARLTDELSKLGKGTKEYEVKEKEVERTKGRHETARTAVTETQAKVDFEMKTMTNSLSAMLASSAEAIAHAAKSHEDAKELELNHKMFLASKKGKDFHPIMEEADLFEKEYRTMEAAMQNQMLAMQKALMDAFNEGNSKAVRAAAEDLDRFTRQQARTADNVASRAIGYHATFEQEVMQAARQEEISKLRYGQHADRKRRAREVVGSGSSVPNS